MQLRRPKDTSNQEDDQSPQKRLSITKRLQPTESLHMKTRAASKNASVATSNDGSELGNESRRSSRADINTKNGGSDSDSNRPTKRPRISHDIRSERLSFQNHPEIAQETIVVARSGSQVANGTMTPDQTENNGSEGSSSPNDDVSNHDDPQQDIAQASIEFPLLNELRRPIQGKRKRRVKRMPPSKVAKTSASQTPTYSTPSRLERISSTKNESPEKREHGKLTKRLPGRRRAPNPDSHIEADLRRQLELKVAYRAVTKALKPVLAELAKRTAIELEEDPELHCRHEEYDKIISVLDARLKQRLDWLNSKQSYEEARLERMLLADKDSAKIRFEANVRDIQSDSVIRCQHKILSVIRRGEREGDSEGTEDEDDVVPRLRRVIYPGGERVLVDHACDSRSRFFVEVQNYWKKFNRWHDFRKEQEGFDSTTIHRNPKGFATFDGEKRRSATAIMNVHQLAKAAEDVEDRALKAAQASISNQDATGLQALATASDMAVKVAPNSAGKGKVTRKALPPLSVSFAPVYTAPVSANNQRPTITPSPKRRAAGRVRSNQFGPPDVAPGPPAPPHIQSSPNISMIPNPAQPPYGAIPFNYGPNEVGGYGAFREPYPPMRHSSTDPNFHGGQMHEQPGPNTRPPNPPYRPPEQANTPIRPEGPPSGSHFTFPLQPKPPPPTILPPYSGPYSNPMPPPPTFRHTTFQAPPSARSPPNLQSPVSPFAIGYPPHQVQPGNQQRRDSMDSGTHRRSLSDWKSYREISSRPSMIPPGGTPNPGSSQSQERPPHQTLEAPGQMPSRKPSSDDASREGHPLPPPPPQTYGNSFPTPPFAQPGQSPYYPPNNFYPSSGPPRYGPIGASSPPTQGTSNPFFAGNFRQSLPQYQQSPAFPPISPHGMPGQSYAPAGSHSRPSSIPLQQHPGQIGHQTILPATLDPKRHQTNDSPGPPPFPVFSQLTAIPRPPYGHVESGPERPRSHQPNPVHFQFESYKGPPKR